MNMQALTSNKMPINNITTPLSSLFKTTLWALTLLLAPQIILGFLFGVFYGFKHSHNYSAEAFQLWFATMPVLLTVSILSPLISLPLLIKATPKQNQTRLFEFWALKVINKRDTIKWLLITLLYWGITTIIALSLNLPDEPFMLKLNAANNSFSMLVLILSAICVVAPIMEELLFRGWLFSKIAETKLGNIGALIISSLAFTAIHSQYQHIATLVMLFSLGLLLGWVRYKAKNVSYTILMHMIFNSVAMINLFLL